MQFPCQFLGEDVILTERRNDHIEEKHPVLVPHLTALLSKNLAHPDEIWGCQDEDREFVTTEDKAYLVRRLIFIRRHVDLGCFIHVIVSPGAPDEPPHVVTAFPASGPRRERYGTLMWERGQESML